MAQKEILFFHRGQEPHVGDIEKISKQQDSSVVHGNVSLKMYIFKAISPSRHDRLDGINV